jgi:uncharacterized protein with GYD domain
VRVKEAVMPKFLVNVTYTAQGAAGLRKDGGTKRVRVAEKAIESVGGTLDTFFFSFGKQDAIVIADMPSAVAAAALSLAISSTGAVHVTTTPLLTPEEMDQACSKKTSYKVPGA